MSKRSTKRRVDGWLIVDKPAGMTSTSVVNKVKWALDAKKAGHAGTLDPEATGVLAVALGEATKTVPYISDALKAYEFTVRLGQATNTDDTEGEVIAESDSRPTDDQIKAALKQFEGEIRQVPPQFSAVKVDGQRAYKLARDGEDLDLAARDLWVEELKFVARPDADHVILEMTCGKGGVARPDADHVILEMTCGKGGYVRSIARDLGAMLGCYGHVESLRRIWSGPFELSDCITVAEIDALAKTPELEERLLPLQVGLDELPELRCRPEAAARLRNGNPGMVAASDLEYGEEAWVSCDGEPIAIGVYKAGELHPTRVFVKPEP